jgi:hypothetical protein
MNFLDFNGFINESIDESDRRSVRAKSPMTPTLKKSLDRIGKSFQTDEDIVKAIELLGFKREPLKPNSNGAEYIFVYDRDPDGLESRYITYENGYVRAIIPKGSWGRRYSKGTHNMTPISDQYIPTTRERLLLVFRRALKKSDLYQMWAKTELSSDDPVAEFFEKKKGALLGKKYGL